MSRRNTSRPLVAKKTAENTTPNVTDKSQKKGFLGRFFSKKDETAQVKQTAATTRRKRRRSKLATEQVDDKEEITEKINQTKSKIQELEQEIDSLDVPPYPPPPPPPPPPVQTTQTKETAAAPNDQQKVIVADILDEIRNMDRSKLKPTGMRRSIGGTPIKEKKTTSSAMTSEARILESIVVPDSSDSETSYESEEEGF